MNQNIKVSVIIPVYGVEKFIVRCAKSLFEQTMTDGIEFIFVDDCTKDRSIEILYKILEEYPNRKSQVTILKHEYNKGLPQARKTGVAMAKGEFIAHCDSDDWVDKRAYQTLYDNAIKEDADIVCCNYYNSDGTNYSAVSLKPTNMLLAGPVWNKLVSRSLYQHDIIYPTANKAEDGALMAQLSFYARKVVYIEEVLYYYFQNPDSMCRIITEEAMLKRLKEEIANTELRIDFLKRENALDKHKIEVLRWKKACRNVLQPYMYKREYVRMWRRIYPEINKQLISSPNYNLYAKFTFVLDYLGLHKVSEKVKSYFRK